MLSAVEHLMARVYTEAAGSKQSQGEVGAHTLFPESLHLEFHSGLYHLSYDNLHVLLHVCSRKLCCVVMFLADAALGCIFLN